MRKLPFRSAIATACLPALLCCTRTSQAQQTSLPEAPQPTVATLASLNADQPLLSTFFQQPSTDQQQPQRQPMDSSSQSNQAPSLSDLGLTPAQTKADPDAQHRLDRRTHDLKVHQTLGLITLAPIAAACITSGLAPPDPRQGNNETGRDIHVGLGAASVAMYGFTAYYAIKAPRIPNAGPTRGGIKLHKYLIYIHAPGMILTPILGAMAYNQASNGQKVTGIASAHGAVAWTTAVTYAASIVAVSWPLRLGSFGVHHDDTAAASTSN